MLKNSKIIALLGALNYKELKRFGTYVQSPFFNTNARCIELYQWFRSFHPTFDDPQFSEERLFQFLFGTETYDAQKLRYALTDLTVLLEDFLAYTEYERQETRRKHLLLQNLERNGLDKYFKQHLQRAEDAQQQIQIKDTKWFHNQLLLEEDAYHFSSTRDNRAIDTRLQELSDNIDLHFLSLKLKTSCEIINRKNVLNVEHDTAFLQHVLDFLEKQPVETPAVAIYHQILRTLQTPEQTEHYYTLKGMLKSNLDQFSMPELRDMYAYVQNYCIRQANLGNSDFLNELFDAYRTLLDSGIIYVQGHLSQFDFKNMVTVGLRVEEYDWVEAFITRESAVLPEDFRQNAITYNLARLHFARKDFKQALRLLFGVEFTDVYYHLDSKSLLLKTYYELEDFEPLLSLIKAFRVYLRRNRKISTYQLTIYNNLIKYVKQLTRLKLGRNVNLTNVKADINNTKQIADLSWLNQKVEEVESELLK